MTQLLVTADNPPRTIEVENGKCRSCGAPIAWGLTAKGKRCPYNEDGTSHFGNCPQAKSWTKKKERP